MMFKVRIGDNSALLNPDQYNALLNILDGATVWQDRYRGKAQGFYGADKEYEVVFKPFAPSNHLRGIETFSDQEIDALSTLIHLRNNPQQENENA